MAGPSRAVSAHVRLVSTALTAGVLGGVANLVLAWLFGVLHIISLLGVDVEPELNKADLYQKAFWGGIFGLALLLPLKKITPNLWLRVAILGCLPALVQIFIVFPSQHHNVGGTDLGVLMPLLVFVFNILGWSLPAFAWFIAAGYEDERALAEAGIDPLLE